MRFRRLEKEERSSITSRASSWIRIYGSSMRPLFRPGDEVCFRAMPGEESRLGDVILYQRGHQMVMHRLLKVNHDDHGRPLYYLKGDALEVGDRPVRGERILGKVVARKRGSRIRSLEGWVPYVAGYWVAWISPYSRWMSMFRRLARRISGYTESRKDLRFGKC